MRKSIPIAAAFVLGGAFVANAQPQYQPPQYQGYPYLRPAPAPPYQSYPYSRPAPLTNVPPSWFYNPYTDGTVRDSRAGGGS
jgi:hypothetical protein